MHGPHQPIGTDTMVAKAFALRLAEEANGLVLPEVHYTWAGATDGFAGTISLDMELVFKTLEAIFIKAMKMGFRRLIAASIHGPNTHIVFLFARQFYEKYHMPVLFINIYKPFTEENKNIFSGEYENAKEASLVLGALQILGKTDLYSEDEMSYDDEAPQYPESLREIRKVSEPGYFMQDTRQHACPSVYISREKGTKFINSQVACVLPTLVSLDEYIDISAKQKNMGWWGSTRKSL